MNATAPRLPALVINLDRSPERWARISSSIPGSGLAVERIPAVDGATIPPSERSDLKLARFKRYHGRTVLDGEYGCYQSHLLALRSVVERQHPIAIIAEDDIGFTPNMDERVLAAFEALPSMDLLKLVNHRITGFVRRGVSKLGDEIGRCLHGPQGSAACYAVTQNGARQLLRALVPMWLPYDIAFERGWATGAVTFTTQKPLVVFDGFHASTTIATRQQYRDAKLRKIEQVGTLLFRGTDYVARMSYAVTKA